MPARVLALSMMILFWLAPACVGTTSAAYANPLGAMHCASSTPATSNTSFPEVRGITAHGTLWALLFYRPPAKAGITEKIVLRITGKGPIHAVALGPQGQRILPQWGPEQHGGSSWNRPGGEWGTGWHFPSAGCWHIHAKRAGTSGNVWLKVVAP